mgnify:CR=1 FL=1|jgi:hypothetical protein|tara:strand:- start:272 stop:418 length:147 start_codon:yes stop_codon:yes gene_type:complete
MSNQIAKMFSQTFGTKVTLKSQQGLGYGTKSKRLRTAGKKKKKKTRTT